MRRVGGLIGAAALVLLAGCAGAGNSALPGTCNVSGSDASITAEQNANAKTIANVALGLGLGQRGAEVGIVTALTESTLNNVGFGDTMVNGSMSSSRGLFQQLNAWGPLADRMDPTKATTMFFTGGQAGQKGLMDVAGWQQMTIPQAAQAVERSEFSDGSNYAKNLEVGLRIAASVLGVSGGAASCSPSGGAIITNGVNVTLPNSEFVASAVRGKTVVAPNAGMAKGIAAGLGQLGLPYVWGGSPADGGPADNGCSRGGGALNSCGSGPGSIGFDCSGLTAFVIVAGGFPPPGTNSSAQRNPARGVPWTQAVAGSIVGFVGHVAIYLGKIDGTAYILEASQVGVPVHVVPLTRTDFDPVVYNYWPGGTQ